MAQYAIYDLTPGETAQLSFTVQGLAVGETVSNATLEVRSRAGAVMMGVKSITASPSADGQIDVSAGVTTLVFNLTATETEALHPREPYYLFTVNSTTSLGRRQAIVPIGRISPSASIGSLRPLRIGFGRATFQLSGIGVGSRILQVGIDNASVSVTARAVGDKT